MANKPTILIIGASRGLGLALVEQFCGRHWHVIATVRRKSAALDALKALRGLRAPLMERANCTRSCSS